MRSHCNYIAEFDAKTKIYVGQRTVMNESVITVDVGVTFNNPKKLDHRPLPRPCRPSNPRLVGLVNKVRLIWATNLRKEGNWIFTTRDKGDEDAEYLGHLDEPDGRTDYWRFTFRVPPWGVWKTVTADYTLKPVYKRRQAQDNCAYYKEDSATIENTSVIFGGEGLTTLKKWEPDETELPTQDYECYFLNRDETFTFTTPDEIKQLFVAPPQGTGMDYRINYDYLGGYRGNLAEMSFREPGVYAVKVVYKSGESIRFCAVDTLGKNTVTGAKQTLPLGLMQHVTPPGTQCALYVSNDMALAAYAHNILPNYKLANDLGVILAEIDHCCENAGGPIQVLLSSHGQPGQFEIAGTAVSSFPGGYGYGGTCAATWELDKLIDGGIATGGHMHRGLKGCADQVHFWAGLTGALLEENVCHMLKYVAERMVEQGGVAVAQASAWDCPFFAVNNGTTRKGYYTYPKGGNYVTYTSHSTYLPMGTPSREESKEQPNFYA